MKTSLKKSLQSLIISHGYVSTREIEEFCRSNNYKSSNAERRLRFSESGMIESVKVRGVIVGYKPRKVATEIKTQISYTLPEMTEPKINAMMVKPEKKELGLF